MVTVRLLVCLFMLLARGSDTEASALLVHSPHVFLRGGDGDVCVLLG